MEDIKTEFVKEIMETLKIPMGAFNFSTVMDGIKHIDNSQFRPFHKALFGTEHSFLNGMDRIVKVAEQFKHKDNDIIKRVKRLIHFTESLNTQIGNEAEAKGEDFVKMVKCVKLDEKYNKTLAVMSLVNPYRDDKQLIINIRRFQTGTDTENAFKQAIEEYDSMLIQDVLIHGDVKKLIVPQKVYYDKEPKGNKI